MFRTDDTSNATKEIQKYLHYISDTLHSEIPLVAIDGVFGNETKEAVMVYQEIKSLPVSGIVDYNTFTFLYDDYLKTQKIINCDDIFIDIKNFPLSRNDRGIEVAILNLLLNELKTTHSDIPDIRINDYFSKETEEGVRILQNIFLFPVDGLVDIDMYDRMIYELRYS